MPEDWVITLSPDRDTSGEHLYKRSEVKTNQVFPPLFGWEPCTTAEGVPGNRAAKLSQGQPKLEYHHGPVETGPGAMSPWEEWDQQGDTSSSLVVCVISANNIPDSHASKFHCSVQVPDKNEMIESSQVQNSTDPVWKFKSPLLSWNPPDCLQFTVFANSNIKIGEARLDYAAFREKGFVGKVPMKLFGSDDPNATVNVCVTMPGQLTPGVDVELKTGRGAKIGIEVAMEANTSLSIVQIAKGGLVDLWNGAHPEQRVNLRDIITEIDGTRGTCYDLLSKLAVKAEPRTIRMKVQRNMSLEE